MCFNIILLHFSLNPVSTKHCFKTMIFLTFPSIAKSKTISSMFPLDFYPKSVLCKIFEPKNLAEKNKKKKKKKKKNGPSYSPKKNLSVLNLTFVLT